MEKGGFSSSSFMLMILTIRPPVPHSAANVLHINIQLDVSLTPIFSVALFVF